jgi:putative PIG3 family NAD(P)H quinone oxidoreductase
MQREGKYPPPPGAPDILGLEVAGVVTAVGENVREWKAGDEVCALTSGGGYAELAAVPAGQVLPIPPNWTAVEAASLPENTFTVYDNLFTRARLRSGESVLVHGGTSGIGTTAIMLAKAFGASFIAATAGTDAKCAACRDLGADLAINYRNEDFVAAILEATQRRGVDVILDVVGGDYVARDLDALAFDGRAVCLATARGTSVELDLRKMLYKRAAVLASSLRARTVEQKTAIAHQLLANVWPRLPARDPVRPVIDRVYSFEAAADAHRRLDASEHIGKIVLTP